MSENEPNKPPLFQAWQKKVLAATVTVLCLITLALAISGLIVLLGKFLSAFSAVLWPLAAAGILALILRPLARQLEKHTKISPVMAVVTIYGAAAVLVAGGAALLVPLLFQQVNDLIRLTPELLEGSRAFLETHLGKPFREFWETHELDFQAISEEFAGMIQSSLPFLTGIGQQVFAFLSFLTGLAIIPIYLFFFLKSDHEPTADLETQLDFLPEKFRQDLVFLVREFIEIVVSFFRGQLIIALIMGILLSVGFTIFGLRFSLLLGLLLGLFNIIPYLGTILGFAITIPLAFLQPEGGWPLAISVVGVFVAVQAFESWFLTPRIMGERTGLHPVAIMIAIFFWGTALGGLLGMILAIPLTAFLVVFWRLLRQKYLPRPT
ncbi:MAG: AI-2E family transporter [Opitutales bacterium]|nr:AI-2E family transporter [Opitutales bacterium]MCH8540234.1 AI-2E family transporter [Opitutales bacterium]